MGRHWVTLKDVQQGLLGTTTAFVSFRSPGAAVPQTFINPEGVATIRDLHSGFTELPGFVFAPFRKNQPALYMDGRIHLTGTEFPEPDLGDNFAQAAIPELSLQTEEKASYTQKVQEVIAQIRSGTVKKVVISRPIVIPFSPIGLSAVLFEQLCKDYPKAFVYLAWIPGYGLWVGATPEMLLKLEDGAVTSIALAGTRKPDEVGEWGHKEIDEHEWVCRHIEEKMAAVGCTEISRSGTVSVAAGTVSHLKTEYKAKIGKATVGALLHALHPTPAVCGWPQKEAFESILKTEGTERGFYTGFLGPVTASGNLTVYVNLRCMQITGTKAIIYSGGGITAASDPGAEWEETELKSATLLNSIKKIQNFAPNLLNSEHGSRTS